MKRVEKKSFQKGDANAKVAATRRTGEHMPKGSKRVANEVETDPFAEKLNHGGALQHKGQGKISSEGSDKSAPSAGLQRKVGSRKMEGGRLKPMQRR